MTGEYTQGKIRIPDVTVLKDPAGPITNANIEMIYEIKFPKDRPAPNQIKDYGEIVDNDPNRVEILRIEDCKCNDRSDPDPGKVPDSILQDAIDRANACLFELNQKYYLQLEFTMRRAGLGKEYEELWNEMYDYAHAKEMAKSRWERIADFLKLLGQAALFGGRGLGRLPLPKKLPPLPTPRFPLPQTP